MITRLAIENFKSFKKVDIKLGRLNIFIGANASGKSNFFDALRVFQGFGYGFTIHEVLDGKPKSATSEMWEQIRGGSAKAAFLNGGSVSGSDVVRMSADIARDSGDTTVSYTIAFSPKRGALCDERLTVGDKDIFTASPESTPLIFNSDDSPVFTARYYQIKQGRQPHLDFEKSRPILHQIGRKSEFAKKHESIIETVTRALSNMQRIDPHPSLLRQYSQAHEIRRMGEHGENFAALVKTICSDNKSKEAFESWLRELRPREVESVGTLLGAVGEPLFMVKEGTHEFPAQVLSDGTLRFAAITAALFQSDLPDLMAIEEIENGIHASRLRLIVELLRNRTSGGRTQVIVTTHSPIVLAWLKPEEYAFTFFCKRDAQTGESVVKPLTEIPHFNEVIQKQPISDLFAEGWLEAAL